MYQAISLCCARKQEKYPQSLLEVDAPHPTFPRWSCYSRPGNLNTWENPLYSCYSREPCRSVFSSNWIPKACLISILISISVQVYLFIYLFIFQYNLPSYLRIVGWVISRRWYWSIYPSMASVKLKMFTVVWRRYIFLKQFQIPSCFLNFKHFEGVPPFSIPKVFVHPIPSSSFSDPGFPFRKARGWIFLAAFNGT